MTSFRNLFECDLRSLALFRLALGLAFLIDLLSRARDLRAHYTYFGVIPEPTGVESVFLKSLYLVVGSVYFQGSVFLVAGLFAVAVAVGYKTKFSTLICWFLLLWIQSRNNLVFQGGDKLLLLMFFWGYFLPLGARYSVDAIGDNHSTDNGHGSIHTYFSMGTVAILLQVACLYFFSALLKNTPEWMPDGTALHYALHLGSFARPVGEWVLHFPSLLQWLTYYVWILEFIGPFLLFSPWFFLSLRLSLWVQFVALHVGIVLCMNVGLFPLFNTVSLLLFIPSWFWDRLIPLFQSQEKIALTIFYDEDCGFCRKMCLFLKTFLILPSASIHPAQPRPEVFEVMERENSWVVYDSNGLAYTQWEGVLLLFRCSPIFWPIAHVLGLSLFHPIGTWIYQMIANNRGTLSRLTHFVHSNHADDQGELRRSPSVEVLVGVLALYMIFINLTTVPNLPLAISDPVPFIQRSLGLNQIWDMFAPSPREWDGWYVVSGQVIDGTAVNVSNGELKTPNLEDSSLQEYPYSSYRWRKYLQNIVATKFQGDRKHYGAYLCRLWNESHQPLQHLLHLEIDFIKEDTPPPNSNQRPKQEIMKLWRQGCLKNSV